MNVARPYVRYRKTLQVSDLCIYCVMHRWRTLYRSHPSSFQCKSYHNRSQHCIYPHLPAGRNVHNQHFSSTIHHVSNHQTTSTDHCRPSRHISEPASIRLLSTNRTILCWQSSNIYTKFDWRRWLYINYLSE